MQPECRGTLVPKDRTGIWWLRCPSCGSKLMQVDPETEAKNLRLYCRHCKQSLIVNIARSSAVEPD